ncbi:uncharacterized protein RCC_05010 [Ramularia collo-cygni]|uniref:Uncharacterized protein n=1 Tax=Ramularia collo-cygni TaxID=112498 RepID=A0A2D3V970_9PEZI|nr:uncharacterized protein RCC_05010 [Ramularia collo-cygni]CZT19164.1 uncharacterized protein RCC_05010 [Ramularia collo-cygni]
MKTSSIPALSLLQSKAQVELLDAIDKLRAHGLSGTLDLPQLIVCGKQSCGKSSVLEAISQVRFPVADTTCTRIPTELVLRKANTSGVEVKLIPAPSRTEEARNIISEFSIHVFSDERNLENIIKPAEEFLRAVDGHPKHHSRFYEDRLQAVVYGPDLPSLTLVDLPGLVQTRECGTENIEIVERVVRSYASEQNSIILAVIAADDDVANQGVLELAKSYDPEGVRTLGIFTKPDKTEAGSPAEAAAISCALNESFRLGLGWHVLKNREGHAHRNDTIKQRNEAEDAFFRTRQWKAIPESARGSSALRKRLGDVIVQAIQRKLPALDEVIQKKIAVCKHNLRELDGALNHEESRRLDLTWISVEVEKIIRMEVQGICNDKFIEDTTNTNAHKWRLRAQLREILYNFADHIHLYGMMFTMTLDCPYQLPSKPASFFEIPVVSAATHRANLVRTSELVGAVRDYLKHNRCCELHGLASSAAVAHLFRVQSSPWKAISIQYVDICWNTARAFVVQALRHVAPPHIAQAILSQLVDAELEGIRSILRAKVEELLRPYNNRRLVASNQKQWEAKVEEFLLLHGSHNISRSDVALQALAIMDSYYKITLPTFTENIATLAIENCLIDGLSNIFTTTTVKSLSSEAVHSLTPESLEAARSRSSNEERLSMLNAMSAIIKRHCV